jgi:hypothetical protein
LVLEKGLTASKGKVFRAHLEERINEGKNTLRRDKTSRHRFEANQA